MEPIFLDLPYVVSYKPPRRRGNFYYNPLSKAKEAAQDYLRCQYFGALIDEPIIAEVEFHIALPQSYPKKKRAALLGKPCLKRLDVDNLQKFLFDTLTGTVITDDSLIWQAKVSKYWAEHTETKITLS